jgi:MbtH protein
VANPFENEDASYLVLVNGEGQHSLWPEAIGVPPGWRAVFGGRQRQECLDYVEANWTDILPRSLAPHMGTP